MRFWMLVRRGRCTCCLARFSRLRLAFVRDGLEFGERPFVLRLGNGSSICFVHSLRELGSLDSLTL